MPDKFSTGGGFWVFEGDKVSQTEIEGRPWLAVGEKFLALLAYVDPRLHSNPDKPKDEVKPEWGPLLYMRIRDGKAAEIEANASLPALQAVSRKSLDQIGDLLKETDPDPKAAKYMDEDPTLRWLQVEAER